MVSYEIDSWSTSLLVNNKQMIIPDSNFPSIYFTQFFTLKTGYSHQKPVAFKISPEKMFCRETTVLWVNVFKHNCLARVVHYQEIILASAMFRTS